MFSKNFFYRVRYQINRKATFQIVFHILLDRLKHPFIKSQKQKHRKKHIKYLDTKKISNDFFSINSYYWNYIINKKFKEFFYLEIGSWEGNSASFILKNFKTKKVICVDIWDKYDDDEYKNEHLRRFENFQYNLNEFRERFSFFKNTSDEFFKNNKEDFDIIYIDGDHEAPQVYRDLHNSWNSLNINGMIICDDYFSGEIRDNLDNNLPANSINKFLLEKKNKVNIVCVNNAQIFLQKISN